MSSKIPTYPQIQLRNNFIETRVRVYHEGQWYSTIVREAHHDFFQSEEEMSEFLSRFNHNIYIMIMFGKVDLNIQNASGSKVFELDPDQRSEQTRMRQP